MTARLAVRFLALSALLFNLTFAKAQHADDLSNSNSAAAAASDASSSAKAAANFAASAATAASAAVAAASSAAQSASHPAPTPTGSSAPLPAVQINCARVIERAGIFEKSRLPALQSATIENLKLTKADCAIPANSAPSVDQLVGAGDVELFLENASYAAAIQRESSPSPKLNLYLNGVDMASDADLIAVESTKDQTRLQFHVKAGPSSQTLWASLYRTVGLVRPEALRVGLGWDAAGQSSTAPAGPTVSVTDYFSLYCAIAVVIVLLYIWVIRGSAADVFRDAPLPPWWVDAVADRGQLKSKLAMQVVGKAIPVGMQTTWENAVTQHVTNNPTYPGFATADTNAYLDMAQDALNKKLLTAPNDQTSAYFGLLLRDEEWKPVRATFSLSRVQLGLWFIFAVCAGVFLWIVYGDLPAIDGSLLGLLGISVGTTGISLAVDQNAGGRPYQPSQDFFSDLVTGFNDDKQQIHRLQAVVANLLLLTVGIVHVTQSLTYPTFDPTWLVFLGISGVALVAGKQYLES